MDTTPFERENVTIVQMPLMSKKRYLPIIYSQIVVPFTYLKYRLDVLHLPAPIRPFFYWGKTVTTLHDLAVYQNPEWFPKMSWFFTKVVIPASLYKAQRVIAVSDSTKKDLLRRFPRLSQKKVAVIFEGVIDLNKYKNNLEKVSDAIKDIYPYFLFIGTIEPRKNIDRLLKAFEMFINKYPESKMKLVIAGKKGWKYESTIELMNAPIFKDRLFYVGYVSLEEKIYLYKNAFSLVYPSLFEGFGLQLLEAMNVGLPIITSNEGAISEIVLDNAILVDPKSVESIFMGMVRMYEDDAFRDLLIERSYGIASNYTWEACARETLGIYQEVVEG